MNRLTRDRVAWLNGLVKNYHRLLGCYKVSMPNFCFIFFMYKTGSKILGNHYGSVAASGTPDGYREVAFSFVFVERKQGKEHFIHSTEEIFVGWIRENVGDHFLVQPRRVTQRFDVVRVPQKSNIKYKVGLPWETPSESEGNDANSYWDRVIAQKLPFY